MSYTSPFACFHCQGSCNRKGRRGPAQLLQCAECGKYQRALYTRKAYTPGMDARIVQLTREGCGIRSTGRVLGISPSTVIARIKRIAARLGPGFIPKGRRYEVDELSTYIRNKKNRVWVAYALDRKDKSVVGIRVGKRSKRMLRPLIDTLLLADAKRIHTDGCDIYPTLVPANLHLVKRFATNGIERMNLTFRTRLKRLGRRTICYSKSSAMLAACVAVVCWA
ncbi:MAG: IS1 family transposase [Flavobacteriales bacterium]|nr:IS1 family transposase [Flavobacteriales bacterium]MCB9178039.1 IS1 family transposase [Flavobacteriales bacterium]